MGWQEVEKLHVATLDALSKQLHPGERHAVMQGGTSLHLAYGSPRYSEDLDFLVSSAARAASGSLAPWLEEVMTKVVKQVSGYAMAEFGRPVKLKARTANAKGKNPVLYTLTMPSTAKDQAGTTVRCEFFCVEPDQLGSYKARAKPMRSTVLPSVTPVLVVAEAREILLDKVHALGARSYVKYRDVFDLWWLAETSDIVLDSSVDAQIATHLAMYGDADFGAVLAHAENRLASADLAKMRAELERFLAPALVTDDALQAMLESAKDWIRQFRASTVANQAKGPRKAGSGPSA